MKKRVKINGFIIFFACLLIVSFPTIFFRNNKPTSSFSFDTVAEVFGITFILLGQIFRVSSRGFKSEHSRDGHSLIQNGPYALVRNPMYLGILLIGAGIVLMLFNWWVIGIFLLVFIIRYLRLIFKEEKKLQAMFAYDYPTYQEKVPRILPSLSCLWEKDISEYLPLKLSWLKKEIGSILVVLLTVLFLESWEDIKNKGIAIYFKEVVSIIAIILLFIAFVIYLSKRTVSLEKNVSNKSKSPL
jgi:protein-S-isoprenylcysteine O-methyltransferase Ste14